MIRTLAILMVLSAPAFADDLCVFGEDAKHRAELMLAADNKSIAGADALVAQWLAKCKADEAAKPPRPEKPKPMRRKGEQLCAFC